MLLRGVVCVFCNPPLSDNIVGKSKGLHHPRSLGVPHVGVEVARRSRQSSTTLGTEGRGREAEGGARTLGCAKIRGTAFLLLCFSGGGVQGSIRRQEGGGGSGTQKFVYQKWPNKIFLMINSIAYQQGTSKREGAQSVNQSISHEIIQKPPDPLQTPKSVEKHIKRV